MELNENKIYLIGLMLADGGLYKYKDKKYPNTYHYKIDFVGDETEEFVKKIADIVRKEFDIIVYVKKHHSANCYYASNFRKEVWGMFVSLGIPSGNKTLTISVPLKIESLTKEQKIALVRGIFDGEGSILLKKDAQRYKDKIYHYAYPVIELKVSSEKLLENISVILKELKIEFAEYHYNSTRRHEIHIRKKENLKKFKEVINFEHPNKRRKLEAILATINSS